jgi:hypothetical protein
MLTQTMLYSEVNIKRTERFLMNSTFCVLLLCPVIALIYVNNKAWKLVILAIFVLGASVLTSSFSDAADQSSLAVVAGWVFLACVICPFVQELLTYIGSGFLGTLPYWWCFYPTISVADD